LSAILNATTPMFAALVALIWLRDGLGVWRSLGLALGFAGVIVLAWDQASFKATGGMGPLLAVLACLGACMSYAVAASYTRLHLNQVPPLVTATGSQIGASVALALPAAFTWPTQAPSATAWLAVLVVGVVCTGLAYLLFYRLIARGSPSRTMTVGYLIPLFAVVYGVLLLDEHLTPAMVTGGLVILLGTALASGLLQPKR
jgi:drug/metabolite transporter (DMT)-like permease